MDIHGGGFDLRFPHHDNELAQSEVGVWQVGGPESPPEWGSVGGLPEESLASASGLSGAELNLNYVV